MAQQPNYGALSGPTDYQSELADIKRRQMLAQALQEQGMQGLGPTEQVGGWAIQKSPLEGLAKAAQTGVGAYQQKELLGEQRALDSRVRTQGANDAQMFAQALQGTPAISAPADELGGGPAAPAVAGDRQKALAIALQSQNPMVRNAGSSMLAEMLNPKAPIKVGATDRLVDPRTNKVVYESPAPPPKYHVVGGNLVPEPQAGQTAPVAPAFTAPKDQWGEPFMHNGQSVQRNAVTGEIRQVVRAPNQTNVATNVTNAGPKAFETELGKLDAEQLGGFRNNAQSAQQTLGIVQNLRDAEAQGAYSGGAAQAKTQAANLINGLTGVVPKGLVGSQLYNAEASKLVLEKVKTLGANPSNADREFIEKTVPQLGQSQEARTALANFLEAKANQQIELYKKADTHARANHGLGGFDITQQPTAPSVPPTDRRQAPRANTRVVVSY